MRFIKRDMERASTIALRKARKRALVYIQGSIHDYSKMLSLKVLRDDERDVIESIIIALTRLLSEFPSRTDEIAEMEEILGLKREDKDEKVNKKS